MHSSIHHISDHAVDTTLTTLFSVIALAARYILSFLPSIGSRKRKDVTKIPPGPRGWPIVGSFNSLTHYPELVLDKWAKAFGKIYTVWLGNQLFVIVSDASIAKDLMVTNGNVFSSRKEMFLKSQTILAGRGITATPYNNKWRKHRRIATAWLNVRAVNAYTDVLDKEATVLLQALYDESQGGSVPVNPQPHAGRCSLNNMLTIVFGIRTNSINHPLVGHALKLSREFMNCTGPMSNLVDYVPLLQLFPTKMQRRGKKLHQDFLATYGSLISGTKERLDRGVVVEDCLAKSMLQKAGEEDLDHLDMSILATAFMVGGVETTAGIMQWFSAIIPAYPDIQRKAQEELDRIVGRTRLPGIEDEKDLPYCHAIIKEVERYRNPFWLGTPHFTTEDSIYNGYFIPKDTVVVLNTWTMHHDPARYPSPDLFNPDRYINDSLSSAESANLPNPNERDHWTFGAGRRICPGMRIAEREIWLTIARMLWAFDMTEVQGEPIDLNEYDGLSGRSPMPFRIHMKPRFAEVESILKKEMGKWDVGA